MTAEEQDRLARDLVQLIADKIYACCMTEREAAIAEEREACIADILGEAQKWCQESGASNHAEFMVRRIRARGEGGESNGGV